MSNSTHGIPTGALAAAMLASLAAHAREQKPIMVNADAG